MSEFLLKLINDFPYLEFDLPYDVECGDGWQYLVYKICEGISNELKQSVAVTGKTPKGKLIKVVQIKSKFDGLRFYYRFVEDDDALNATAKNNIRNIVVTAEEKSFKICYFCGESKSTCKCSKEQEF